MRIHVALAASAACLGVGAALVDRLPGSHSSALAQEIEAERDHISAPELAERLMKGDSSLMIFDLRSAAAFQEFHIPGARQSTVSALASLPLAGDETIVLYSEGGSHAAQAWVLLRMRGLRHVFFLREGIYEWVSRVDQPRLAIDATEGESKEFVRASKLSRFFGGTPKADVPRSEIPVGYWTTESPRSDSQVLPTPIGKIRRRGC